MGAYTDAAVCPNELGDYEQFTPCAVPGGSGAAWAWSGFIRPFSDDQTARRVLGAIERDVPLCVCAGRLDVVLAGPPVLPLDEFLVGMAEPFAVLLLEFPGTEQPRAFLLSPAMIPRVSACRHLRADKAIVLDGAKLPALCVYSGNLLRFDDGRSILEQLLDQTSTYLAKYLVWLRTRKLFRRTANGSLLVRAARPGERVSGFEASLSEDFFWSGYWPGREAPSGPWNHLATVRPDGPCWCWSGRLYRDCCQQKEFDYVQEIERRQVCADFTGRLMRAVHGKLRGARVVAFPP
jgi:hypothetical protein